MTHYDIIVIGSGGGSKITRPAANQGLTVAVIEGDAWGGTCLNHGCIPSKMLIHPADLMHQLRTLEKFSITLKETPEVDFSALIQRVNNTIDEESASIPPGYEKHPKITHYFGHARFISDHEVEVNEKKLSADKIFIAVGGRPSLPPINGLENTPYLTYKEALRSTKKPQKMIIIGGGFIATELGHFFSSLGTEVHVVVRSKMLKNEDIDIQKTFETVFEASHTVHKGVPESVIFQNNRFHLTIQHYEGDRDVIEADTLLIATGIQPNTDELGLENTGIKTSEKGYITVDDFLQTTVNNVFAFGDVIGRYFFRHSANFEGEYLFKSKILGPNHPIIYPPMPYAVFTHPQIASVGATEQQLKADHVPYVTAINPYHSSAMGMALLSEYDFVKLLVHAETRQILGAHIIGEQASILIQQLIVHITRKETVDDLLDMIYIHPALPEVIRNAARKI